MSFYRSQGKLQYIVVDTTLRPQGNLGWTALFQIITKIKYDNFICNMVYLFNVYLKLAMENLKETLEILKIYRAIFDMTWQT